MILYHLTWLSRADSIRRLGLVPGQGDIQQIGPPFSVWLTVNVETVYPCDENGDPLDGVHDCLVTLVIPSHDRSLVQWGSWLRKRGEYDHFLRNPYLGPERSRRTLQDWYCYRGSVPPEYIRSIETRKVSRQQEPPERTHGKADH
jgi:hypothetical protein